MKELFLLMAKAMPLEILIDHPQEDLQNFKLTGSEEAKKKLATSALLVNANIAMEKQDLTTAINDMQRADRAAELLKPGAQ